MEDIEAEIHNDGDDSTHDLFEQNDDDATDDGHVDDDDVDVEASSRMHESIFSTFAQ